MLHIMLFGLLGAAFFSTSFVLYELMSVQGGHWFWSASLRCVFMWLLLSLVILFKVNGVATLTKLFALFWQYAKFWCLTGSIGLGTYGLLAFGADYAPAWVITSTFLFTVVASLFVLVFFGQRFNKQTIACVLIVFVGILLANLGEGAVRTDIDVVKLVLFGALPAFLAAFCFPIGNQLIWQAGQKRTHHTPARSWRLRLLDSLPYVPTDQLNSPLHKVWLLSLGSLPLWLVLGLIIYPAPPSQSQIGMAFLVALLAGVIGTSIFLYARSKAQNASEVAIVDTTQASEIIFSLLGGMILLGTPFPSMISSLGIMMIIAGLILFAKSH